MEKWIKLQHYWINPAHVVAIGADGKSIKLTGGIESQIAMKPTVSPADAKVLLEWIKATES